MKALLFPRLVWKEYRVLRGYWLSLAVLGVIIELLTAQFASDPRDALRGVPWIVATFFALGAGATIFAVEREERTIDFLRGLPASPSRLFFGKVMLAGVGSLLMGAVLSAVALALAEPDQAWQLAVTDGRGAVVAILLFQVLAWGVFFSLIVRQPLVAALLATAATFVSFVLVFVSSEITRDLLSWRRHGQTSLIPHALATVAIFVADYALTWRWLRGSDRRFFAHGVVRATDVRRLWWQTARQSRLMLGVVLALAMLLSMVNWASAGPHSPLSVPIATLVFALLGSCVFLADQEGGQFRYFAERGIAARRLWLARQLFWATPLVALMVFYFLAHVALLALVVRASNEYDHMTSRTLLMFNYGWFGIYLGDPHQISHVPGQFGWLNLLPGYLTWSALAYGSGQLCSMFFRSGLLAAVFGVITAAALVGWAVLMAFLENSWFWTVAPLAIALFVSTWVRCPDWLIERSGWGARWRAAVVLAVPLAAVLVGTSLCRVYEAPAPAVDIVTRPAEVSAGEAAEARRTAELYNRATELLVKETSNGALPDFRSDASTTLDEPQLAWLRDNQEPLSLVLEAAARPDCAFGTSAPREGLRLARLLQLGHLLVLSARQLEEEGDLDAAWARYQAGFSMARHFHQQPGLFGEQYGNLIEQMVFDRLFFWGAQKDQTPDRIRAAIGHIHALAPLRPMADEIREEYRDLSRRLFYDGDSWSQRGEAAVLSRVVARWMPWELTRSQRTLALFAELDIDDVKAAESSLAGKPKPAEARYYEDPYRRMQAERLARTSLYLGIDVGGEWFQGYSQLVIVSRRQAVAYRRAARLVLAAEAWRLEHDELPDSLARLEESGLVPLPVDPYTNRSFEYLRFGFHVPVASNNLTFLAPRTPLLYCPGAPRSDYLIERIGRLRRESDDDARPTSETSIDEAERLPGLTFPIPTR